MEAIEAPEGFADVREKLIEAGRELDRAVAYVKEKGDTDYTDYYSRRIVDSAIDIQLGWLVLREARASEHKARMCRKFAAEMLPRVSLNVDAVTSGDTTTITGYRDLLV
jgi:hypothetical protein